MGFALNADEKKLQDRAVYLRALAIKFEASAKALIDEAANMRKAADKLLGIPEVPVEWPHCRCRTQCEDC